MRNDTRRPFQSTPLAFPRFWEKAWGVRLFDHAMKNDIRIGLLAGWVWYGKGER
jgi:hypothetical protein